MWWSTEIYSTRGKHFKPWLWPTDQSSVAITDLKASMKSCTILCLPYLFICPPSSLSLLHHYIFYYILSVHYISVFCHTSFPFMHTCHTIIISSIVFPVSCSSSWRRPPRQNVLQWVLDYPNTDYSYPDFWTSAHVAMFSVPEEKRRCGHRAVGRVSNVGRLY